MNKVPGPPSSSPLPAPSPNLPQPNFSPTPPPAMVFATPTPPPMNPSAPPRQPYYPVRPTLPQNPSRAQASSAPRPIPPTPHGTHTPHVFQTGSQMMMIQPQPISFPNSQAPAYYISGQYRPSFVSPQQYQVAGSPNYYPGSSTAEYAGAYYPAQSQFTPPVAPAPVLMNPAPQQQQAPPPPQHPAPAKRERKQIRIRDPNQGGKDITDEIMSGGRSASTPTPPQSVLSTSEGGAVTQSNGEKATLPVVAARRDERVKPVVSLEFPVPPGESPIPDAPPTPPPTSPISEAVDAPAIDKPKQPKDASQQEPKPSTAGTSNGSTENGAGLARVSIPLPASGAEPALESPIAQPEELQLVNGLTADTTNRDISPLAEPDITKEAPPIIEERSTRTTKAAVKETPAPVASEAASLPAIKEAHVPSVKETLAPKPTPMPIVAGISIPVVTETLPEVAKDTPSLPVKEIPAPVAMETTAPAVKEFPVVPVIPAVKETPVVPTTTVVKESPVVPVIPAVKESPAVTVTPVVKESPAVTVTLAVKESPAVPVTLAVKESPAVPVTLAVKESPAVPVTPVVKESPAVPVTPVVKESPVVPVTLAVKESPAVPVTLAVKESPAVPVTPVVKESPVVPVTLAVKESPAVKGSPVVPVSPAVKETSVVKASPVVPVTPAVKASPVVPVTPAVKASPVVPVTPAVKASPVVPVTPAVKASPVVPVTPAVKASPVVPVTPAVKASPVVPVTPAVKASPVVPVTPAVKASPVVPVTPAVKASPVVPVTPAVKASPVVPVTPAVKASPVVPVTPAVKESPVAPVTIAVKASPVVPVTPAVKESPVVPVTPAVMETPVAPVTPAIPVTIAVKESPVVPETPAVKETPPPAATKTSEPVVKETVVEDPCPVAKETSEPIVKETPSPSEPEYVAPKATPPAPASVEEREDTPPPQAAPPESTMQAVSVPKKKRKLKDLNKKEIGDVLDAFKEPPPPPQKTEATPPAKSEQAEPAPVAPPPVEDVEETWEEKEDKLDAENIQPPGPAPATPTEQKYQYKEEQWKPLNPEEKKKYDREFLLGFQFISASMHKPDGLPHISDVVLDKVNKTPLRPLDISRMNCGPDFTPSFALLGRQPSGGRGPPVGLPGPRRSGQSGSRKEPRKIVLSGVSLNDDIQLNKAEKAWKRGGGADQEDLESVKTQDLLRRVRGVLNKLTPQMFQPLMKQITEMSIDTEERLKGVIDLVFEKAISEPNFSVAYANMCRCLTGLKVPSGDKPGKPGVNFRKLLLNRCQKEFEKDKDDDEIFEKKQKELDAATEEELRQRLKEELEEAKNAARRRSLGNIKFIGELFKLKMLTENIMHDCVVKLLKNHDEESLECLCRLLSTIGKDLDFEKAKPRMDQYFNQMDKIIKERKTSSRIRFMLQDVIDLRRNNWVPRRGDQGPKTIEQIHKDAQMEEQREQIKVQQQLMVKKESRGGGGGSGVTLGPRGVGSGSHHGNPPQDDGWNTVPISTKNRPIDTTRLSKITKPGAMDFNNQLLAPGGKGSWGSWGKGSSGGSGDKPRDSAQDSGRTSTLNRFSALQQTPSSTSSSSNMDTDRRVPQRNSSSRERGDQRVPDRNRPAISKRSFSRDKDEREQRPAEMVRRVASMTDERERAREREQEREKERPPSKDSVKREPVATPPPAPSKPALSPKELEKKSTAIIEEYLHINDMKEALQCVSELNSTSLLYLFVRTGIESTLERSTIAREHMGLLLHQLVKAGTLSAQQYYKGLMEVLEVAEDMAIDVPHIWVYLAELIAPMLHEGGIPTDALFREVSKPLVPIGQAGLLLAHILTLLCKGMSHKKVGAMWMEAGLSWKDFLSKDEDVNKFVTEKGVEYTLGEESVKVGSSRKSLSMEEISKHLDQLLQDKADNPRIYNWVEANLDEQQVSSNTFVRALMSSVCQAAIVCETPYKVEAKEITQRAKLLQRYISNEQKELQALYALQSLMVRMEQPPNLLRMFFDALYDEDIIKEDAFYKWETSKDPAEQQGKGVALKSVTAFFTWLREAEDESDNS